ncbi:MAG: ABC transporter ATP-binding protein [Nitriliruptor sp.]|uniref:ABC transporter ATP-binding protein n=1 Tax=Nitriliruptor sp. TaxID=2448056 RepID=UPI0034A07548
MLRNIDVAVPTNGYLSVVGVSGSGKSTLLNILGLMDTFQTGAYEIDGRDATALTADARAELRATSIGFVFQQFNLLHERSVADNVALGLLYAGVPRRQWDQRVEELLDYVGLSHRTLAQARTLSGGEQQRVAIARAVAKRPSILLCDEPTGNLDEATSAECMGLLERLHSDGMTLIVVTHDLRLAERADRTVTIRDGVVSPAYS